MGKKIIGDMREIENLYNAEEYIIELEDMVEILKEKN